MLALTANAAEAIEGILAAPSIPDEAGIRIAPSSPAGGVGTAGPKDLRVTVAEAPAETDEVIDEHGARVFVDDAVSGYLTDKVLDARLADERVSFTLGAQQT